MNYDFLKKAFPSSRIGEILPFVEDAFSFARIETVDQIAMFFATASIETGGIRDFEENLYYSAKRLAEVWPGRYAVNPNAKTKVPNQIAKSIEKQPEMIANLTYANRNGNGPAQSGEGWKYRGMGLGHTTGKANVSLVDQKLNMNGKLLAIPEMMLQPYYAIMSMAAIWDAKNMNQFTDPLQLKAARQKWNGGTHGLQEFVTQFNRLKNLMTIAL